MSARVPTPHFSKQSGYKDATHLPKPYKLRRYYTPQEVSLHQTADDCWVSFFNGVYDLTKLLADNQKTQGELCQPIAKVAGTDISNWFDPINQEVSATIVFNSVILHSQGKQLTQRPICGGGSALLAVTYTFHQLRRTLLGTPTVSLCLGGRTNPSESARSPRRHANFASSTCTPRTTT